MRLPRRQFVSLLLAVALPPATAAAAIAADNGLVPANWRLDMLRRLNAIRQGHDLSPLRIDGRLNQAAQLHSDDMAVRDFFSHQTPDGARMDDRADAFGYQWRLLLENIAAGQPSVAEAIDGWMKSPGHRAAILDSDAEDAGMGYTYRPRDDGRVSKFHYWTLLIGSE